MVALELDFGGVLPALTALPSPAAKPVSAAAAPEGTGVEALAEKSASAPGRAEEKAEPPVLTVTQLTRRVRRLLEQQLGEVWVEGELSNTRVMPNGHAYFTLKDAGAQLSCVLFRSSARLDMPEPEDGLKVRLGGEISVYEPRGQYQLIVRDMLAAGQGALQAQFEALKRRLAAEGLFDAARKRPLPAFPGTVALVTSPGGAALRDMLNILQRRAPWVRALIFPVRVQGAGAGAEIAEAVRRLADPEALGLPRADVLIVGRGGGSVEDLWCFNDEALVRAIAASPIPVISAVGHEIDFTLADFAADVRALTPSAAAELVAPEAAELRRRFGRLQQGMAARMSSALQHARAVVDLHARGGLAREPRRLLAQWTQQVDGLGEELRRAADEHLRQAETRIERLGHRVAALRPAQVLARRQETLAWLRSRLETGARRQLLAARDRCARASVLTRSLGPESVLKRGFTYTTGPDGRPIARAADVQKGDRLTTRTGDGSVISVVE